MADIKVLDLPAAAEGYDLTHKKLLIHDPAAAVGQETKLISYEELQKSIVTGLLPISTAAAIDLDADRQYGTGAAPVTGNLTAGTAAMVNGVTATIVHNAAVEPTYPASWKKTSGCGSYVANVNNYITVRAFPASSQAHILSIYQLV